MVESVPAAGLRPEILTRSAGLQLFLMLRIVQDPDAGNALLKQHLEWMVDAERSGHIFLSGPISPGIDNGGLVGATVLRTSSLEEARAIAAGDPFVKCGYVDFTLHPWTAYEGSLTLKVRLSDSSVEFA